jgi:hypothetical protein
LTFVLALLFSVFGSNPFRENYLLLSQSQPPTRLFLTRLILLPWRWR